MRTRVTIVCWSVCMSVINLLAVEIFHGMSHSEWYVPSYAIITLPIPSLAIAAAFRIVFCSAFTVSLSWYENEIGHKLHLNPNPVHPLCIDSYMWTTLEYMISNQFTITSLFWQDTDMLGCIHTEVMMSVAKCEDELSRDPKYHHCFEVNTQCRGYLFCADNEAEMEEWIKVFEEIIKISNAAENLVSLCVNFLLTLTLGPSLWVLPSPCFWSWFVYLVWTSLSPSLRVIMGFVVVAVG